MSERISVPIGSNRVAVELDVILDKALILVHLDVIKRVFSVTCRIYGTEFLSEKVGKFRPVEKPICIVGSLAEDSRFKPL